MNKCKGCEWHNKPYWSIINPCDNCPRENNTQVEIITRWQDPTIEIMQKEITRLNNIIEELEKWLEEYIPLLEAGDICEETAQDTLKEVLDKLKELKEGKNE